MSQTPAPLCYVGFLRNMGQIVKNNQDNRGGKQRGWLKHKAKAVAPLLSLPGHTQSQGGETRPWVFAAC